MKKFLVIVVLGLLFSLFTSQTISAECKIPKNPKEKIIEAPETVLKKQKTPTNRVEEVLAKRKTINVFRAWNGEYGTERYGLYWRSSPIQSGPSNLSLMEIYWNYHYPKKQQKRYSGIEKFLTKKDWDARGHSTGGEYGKTVWVNYFHPDFAEYFANLVFKLAKSHDGVMLDWWHNNHPGVSENGRNKVKKARRKIAEAIRNKMGEEFIILGNVNWQGNGDTHDFINGVYMELWKDSKSSTYSCKQIKKIEKLIKFHDQHLSEPRIIGVEAWKITKPLSKELEKELAERFRIESDYYLKNRKGYQKTKYEHLLDWSLCFTSIKPRYCYIDNKKDFKNKDKNLKSEEEIRHNMVQQNMEQKEKCGDDETYKLLQCFDEGVYNIDNKYEEEMRNYLKQAYHRSLPENIQFAKFFTAMAMVIPENGYILYADNNADSSVGDKYHTYYDFYNTDLGKPISDGVEIKEGLAYKKYEKGLIAYNRTRFKYTIKFKDGKKVEIGPLEGVFVKD